MRLIRYIKLSNFHNSDVLHRNARYDVQHITSIMGAVSKAVHKHMPYPGVARRVMYAESVYFDKRCAGLPSHGYRIPGININSNVSKREAGHGGEKAAKEGVQQ